MNSLQIKIRDKEKPNDCIILNFKTISNTGISFAGKPFDITKDEDGSFNCTQGRIHIDIDYN